MRDVCLSCGATVPLDALACSLCHAASPTSSALTATIPVTVGGPVSPNGFLPAPPKSTLRNDTREFSRIKEGEVSFGPRGRLTMSLILALPVLFIWFMTGGPFLNFNSFFAIFMTIVIVPAAILPIMALRDIWRAHRVR